MQKPAQNISKKRGFHDQALLRHWQEFVGEEFASLCQPRELKSRRGQGAVLSVECMSAYAAELGVRSEELRMRINAGLGFDAVSVIKIHHQHLGFEKERQPVHAVKAENKSEAEIAIPDNLEKDVSAVENSALRASLENFSKIYYKKGHRNDPNS